MNNVSIEKIQEGIEYLEEQFKRPLIKVGEELIDDYTKLSKTALSHVDFDAKIREQQERLDSISNELSSICEKAKSEMDDSRAAISQREAEIDDALSNI